MIDSTKNKVDEGFMKEALKEAGKSLAIGEVPVGCVIVKDGKVIARGHNQREKSQSVLGHAETIAIQKAAKKLGSWRLEMCDLYVTLEPCAMCSGAMIQARIRRLIYGCAEPKFGAHQSVVRLFDHPFNHQIEVISGVLGDDSRDMLKRFFRDLRAQKPLKNPEGMI
jgi:tRNA(adenine34) deaminase